MFEAEKASLISSLNSFLHGIVEHEPSSSGLVKELGWDFDLEIGALAVHDLVRNGLVNRSFLPSV